MKQVAKFSLILLIMLQLFGCASTTFKSSATLEQRKVISVIHDQGGGVSGFIRGILVPVGAKKDVDIITVDGQEIVSPKGANHREYWLEPGEHEIDIRCSIQLDSMFINGKTPLSHNFLAGEEYVLDAVIYAKSRNECNPVILIKDDMK